MKTMNILLICLVVIVVSFLLFNKNAMSQQSVDAGDVVLMSLQKTDTIVVYHKSSHALLFYGQTSSDLHNPGMQLLQIRNLSSDLQYADALKHAELELKEDVRGSA